MAIRSPCPSKQLIQELCNGTLSREEEALLVGHVGSCQDCTWEVARVLGNVSELPSGFCVSTSIDPSVVVHSLMRHLQTVHHEHQDHPEGSHTMEGTLLPQQQDVAPGKQESTPRVEKQSAEEEILKGCIRFMKPAETKEEIGRLGSYRILRMLGAGGMGAVFEAEDMELRRHVALKMLLPELAADSEAAGRFRREAQAMAAIKHVHIITVYQVGEENGMTFLAMEFLEGETLARRLKHGGQMSLAETTRIGRQIALGLAAAHDRGLIHRDIKPGNIWLEAETNQVRILDFGLARSAQGDSELTRKGMVLGTPGYMAPEQARGADLDHRCDLFSLGCVLYEMASGRSPFRRGTPTATLAAVLTEYPPPLGQMVPTLPARFCNFVMRMMAKNPSERPESAGAVATFLANIHREYAGGDETPTERRRPPREGPSQPDRGPLYRWGVTALFLVGLGVLVYLAFLHGDRAILFLVGKGRVRLNTSSDITVSIWQEGSSANEVSHSSERTHDLPPGEYNLEVEVLNRDGPSWFSKTISVPRGGLTVIDVAAELAADPRQETLGVQPVHKSLRMFHAANTTVTALAFSPVGKTLASGGADNVIRLWDPTRARALGSLDGHLDEVVALSFHPTNRSMLASSSADRTIVLWDAEQHLSIRVMKGHHSSVTGLAFSPAGDLLASSEIHMDRRKILLWDVNRGGEPRQITPPDDNPVRAIAFSPDGKWLVGGSIKGQLFIWNPATLQLASQWQRHSDQPVWALTSRPDSDEVVSAGVDQTVTSWHIPTGKIAQQFPHTISSRQNVHPLSICCSHSGHWLATADTKQTVRLWDARTGKEVLFLRGAGQAVCFSHDDRWLATGHAKGEITVWDVSGLTGSAR